MRDPEDYCMGCDAEPEIEVIVRTMDREEELDRATLCPVCAQGLGGPILLYPEALTTWGITSNQTKG